MNMMNQVILEGNVVRAPLFKETSRGTRLCTLPIAVNRTYKNRDGSEINEVGYYDIEAWGENLLNSIERCGWKGRGLHVVGRLKQSRWKTTDGRSMHKISVVAEHIDFKPAFRKHDGTDSDPASTDSDGFDEAESADIDNLQEAAAGIRAEQEAGETVF